MDYVQYEELLRPFMLLSGWVFGILAVGLAVIYSERSKVVVDCIVDGSSFGTMYP